MNLDDPDKHDFPLLRHPVNEESAFTPQALIEAVRAEKGMTSVTVPDVCVLEFDGDLTDQLVQSNTVERWKTWACFHTPMFALEINGRPCRHSASCHRGIVRRLGSRAIARIRSQSDCWPDFGGARQPAASYSQPGDLDWCHSR